MDRKINRIKVVLVEKGRTNKWLAERVGKDPATVSKWCTNAAQPTLEMLMQISKILDTPSRLSCSFRGTTNNRKITIATVFYKKKHIIYG